MDDLVQYLSSSEHAVMVGGPDPSVEEFKRRIVEQPGHVLIKFSQTKGGTELGVRLDNAASDLSQADFNASTGKVHVVGTVMLNNVHVRCIADIDLETLQGIGHLEVIE